MGHPKEASATYIADAERSDKAMQMRRDGATFEQIAAECGYSDKSNASKAVARRVREIGRENAQNLFDTKMGELEQLREAVWPEAMAGDVPSIREARSIIDQQVKMLGYTPSAEPEQTDTDVETLAVPQTLSEVLGTDSAELEQQMARVLNEHISAPSGTDG